MSNNIPAIPKFTNDDINVSKVTRMNKKTAADGTHIGWSVHVIDADGRHYDNIVTASADADKETVKASIKEWLLAVEKKAKITNKLSTSISSALSQDSDGNDIPESL